MLAPRARFLLCCGLVLLPFCFAGYGSDNDTYGVLDSGRITWLMHHLDTSRNPGYWTFEAIVFALSSLGGYLATNLVTLVVGLVCVWRFLRLAERMALPHPLLTAATLVATPVFAIACTSTTDYVWSLLGLALFAECLLADRLWLAVLPAAFAFAIRGANGVVIAGALAGAMLYGPRTARRIGTQAAAGLLAAILGGLPYIASFIAARHSFAFLEPAIGPDSMWTAKMRLGRFAYKLLYLVGPIASVLLLAAFRRIRTSPAAWIFGGAILANLFLFLRYPIEISYLIPALFFGLLVVRTQGRALAVAIFVAVLSLNFVTPQLARPDKSGAATAAHLHPALAPGAMVEDLRFRLKLKHCSDYDCYKSVTTTPRPLEPR